MRAIVVRGDAALGEGRVFVCMAGHRVEDLDLPQVRTIIERGLLWASRVAPAG